MNLETSKEIELKAFLSVYFLELELFMTEKDFGKCIKVQRTDIFIENMSNNVFRSSGA